MGIDPTSRDLHGASALSTFVRYSNLDHDRAVEIIDHLIEKGSDISDTDDDGYDCVLSACSGSLPFETKMYMVDKEGDINKICVLLFMTPFHALCMSDLNLQEMRLVVEKYKPDLTIMHSMHVTIICTLCTSSTHLDVLQYIVDLCPKEILNESTSAVGMCITRNRLDFLECILDAGVPIDLGLCVFGIEINASSLDIIVKFRDINSRDSQGETLLHHSARAGSQKATQKLLELGADPDIENIHGKTPTSYMIESKMVHSIM